MSRPTVVLAVSLIVSCVGCSDRPAAIRGPVRPWDTVKVERHMISSRTVAEVARSHRWALSAQPRFEMGVSSGEGDHIFGSVQGAVMLPNGGVVVADIQASTLLYFDADGRFEATAGGPGEGPGEFVLLFWVGACSADSVYAYDARLGRVSVFTSDGKFERAFRLVSQGGMPVDPPRCSPDGALAVQGLPTLSDVPQTGRWAPPVPLMLADRVGETDTIIPAFPCREYVASSTGGIVAPLGAELLYGLSRDRLFAGFSDRYQIGVFTLTGRLTAVFGLDLPPRDVTQADSRGYVKEVIGGMDDVGRARFRPWIEAHMPDRFPLFDRVIVASGGDVWIRRYPSPNDDVRRWDIFSGHSPFAYRGSLQVPKRFEILDVRGESVLGRWLGEHDEERVRVYTLDSSGGANNR